MPRAWVCTTVVAMNTTTTQSSVLAATLRGEGFTGRLAEPGDHDYDAARAGWNGAIDRRPAAVAYATRRRRRGGGDPGRPRRALDVHHPRRRPLGVGRSVRDGALCIDLRALNRSTSTPSAGSCASAAARC